MLYPLPAHLRRRESKVPDQDSDLADEFARQAKEADRRRQGQSGSGYESDLKAKEDARKLLDAK